MNVRELEAALMAWADRHYPARKAPQPVAYMDAERMMRLRMSLNVGTNYEYRGGDLFVMGCRVLTVRSADHFNIAVDPVKP